MQPVYRLQKASLLTIDAYHVIPEQIDMIGANSLPGSVMRAAHRQTGHETLQMARQNFKRLCRIHIDVSRCWAPQLLCISPLH